MAENDPRGGARMTMRLPTVVGTAEPPAAPVTGPPVTGRAPEIDTVPERNGSL